MTWGNYVPFKLRIVLHTNFVKELELICHHSFVPHVRMAHINQFKRGYILNLEMKRIYSESHDMTIFGNDPNENSRGTEK